MVSQRDAGEYLEILRSRDWKAAMNPNDPVAFQAALTHFLQELKNDRPADYELWNFILNAREKTDPTLSQPFDYRILDDDCPLLREILGGIDPGSFDRSAIVADHTYTVAAIPAYVSCGAALTISSFRNSTVSSRRYLKVTWLHRMDGPAMARKYFETLTRVDWSHRGGQACVFTPHNAFWIPLSDNDSGKDLERILIDKTDHDCFQLHYDELRLFADTLPLDGTELQAGVILPDKLWMRFAPALARLICATNEIPLSERIATEVLREMASFLDISDEL
jgi:hypothetical protein